MWSSFVNMGRVIVIYRFCIQLFHLGLNEIEDVTGSLLRLMLKIIYQADATR